MTDSPAAPTPEKSSSLAEGFVTFPVKGTRVADNAGKAATQLLKLAGKDFDALVVTLRQIARGADAAARLSELEAAIAATADADSRDAVNLRALLLQTITALNVGEEHLTEAAVAASGALGLLTHDPKRKDYPFMVILGLLLYDITALHAAKGEYRQAERSIGKALKVFEKLARTNPERFGAAQVAALGMATSIYRDRSAQAELLTRYQADTSRHMQQLIEQGTAESALMLTRSLAAEGETLARMGRHREAMQYFTRSLKYLTKMESEFTVEQLRLSVALGESMLNVAPMREKGVHLLNTMLHKATRLGAADEHRRIVDALFHARSRTFDILGIWHKIFPNS